MDRTLHLTSFDILMGDQNIVHSKSFKINKIYVYGEEEILIYFFNLLGCGFLAPQTRAFFEKLQIQTA